MDEAALWTSAVGSLSRVTAALWFTQLMLGRLDGRRLSLSWKILLGLLTAAAAAAAVFVKGTPTSIQVAWGLLAGAACLAALLRADAWRRGSPREVHEELKSDSAPPDKRRSRKSTDADGKSSAVGGWASADYVAALGLIGSAVLVIWDCSRHEVPSLTASLCAITHALSLIGLLGIAVSIALETTLGGIGTGLLALNWNRVRYEVSAIWFVSMLTAGCELSMGKLAGEWNDQFGPILFCIGLLVVGYILFAAVQRLVQLKQKGILEGLPSLAVAAWLTVLSLLVVAGLPADWPWQNIK